MTLIELTGQESGIIIFENGDIIVANWRSAIDDYIPMLSPFGDDLINFPVVIGTIEAAESTAREVDDVRDEFVEGRKILYDYNDDIQTLVESDEPTSGIVYTIGNGVKVIAPDGWI